MYIIFILFYLFINVTNAAELKHIPPENKSYIIEEGEISDGNRSTYFYVVKEYVTQWVSRMIQLPHILVIRRAMVAMIEHV